MDPFLEPASRFKRKGLPTLSLVAGVLVGFFLYYHFGSYFNPKKPEPREVQPRGGLAGEEKSTVELFERAAPSVVFITTKRRQWFLYGSRVQETPAGTGSGFIWDDQGHIVTNFHVIQEGNAFEVVLYDQKVYDAKVRGAFPDQDLAVLKIDAPRDKLRPIPLGSTQDLKVGQKVLAIGNPFGLDHTLTMGIVSALNRTLESVNQRKIEGAVQTDAAINPGNSGGPLLDSAGRLIGVNTQIFSTSGSSAGIGFAIPADTVNEVVPQLIEHGRVIRPGLGIYAHPYNKQIMRQLGIKGLLIEDVQRNGAASRAGLRGVRWSRNGSPILGDIILKIDDKEIHSLNDLISTLNYYQVGDRVRVTFIRDGETMKTDLTLQALN